MRYFGLDPVESANRKKEQESATLHVVFCPSSVRRRYRVHGFSVGWCAHVRCYLREVLESRRRADLTAGDLGRVDLGGCPPRSPTDPDLRGIKPPLSQCLIPDPGRMDIGDQDV